MTIPVGVDIEVSSELVVNDVGSYAFDYHVISAARVSVLGEEILTNSQIANDNNAGLINFLMKNRHGTPFEHNIFKFFVSAPIFVFREFHRHRIGFSYNEESGRYSELKGKFYVPSPERNLVQHGKAGAYTFGPGTTTQYNALYYDFCDLYEHAYAVYLRQLEAGVAKEVARMVLPVALYSSMYVTCNARSLMSFLSLRQKHEEGEAKFPSYPMHEINVVANKMEEHFQRYMPITHAAFVANGYVSP
jgi:thymidylate synthase (FAD)